MEITIFGRTLHIFTASQLDKFKDIIMNTVGVNIWYQIAVGCWTLCIILLCISWVQKTNKNTSKLQLVRYILYIFSLPCALILSRPFGNRNIIVWNKSFFMTEHVFHETSILMAVLKFCMLFPLGMMTKKMFNKAKRVTLIAGAFLTGVLIESMKYLSGRGHAAMGSAFLLSLGILSGICFESMKRNLLGHGGENEK